MDYDYIFRVLLLGDSSSGKEEFLNRYTSGYFQDDLKLTIGVDFYSKTTNFKEKKVKLQIWDFRGEERFRFLLHQYCKGAAGAIIMYDITNLKSLEFLPDWTQILREHAGDIPILLVGNKLDLEKSRVVPKEEGVLTAKKYNLSAFVEVSSKTGKNVENAFEAIAILMLAGIGSQRGKREKVEDEAKDEANLITYTRSLDKKVRDLETENLTLENQIKQLRSEEQLKLKQDLKNLKQDLKNLHNEIDKYKKMGI